MRKAFLSLLTLILFLAVSSFLIGKSGYTIFVQQDVKVVFPLFLIMLLDGPINSYLFLQTVQKKWYRLWLVEVFRPFLLLLVVLIFSVTSLKILLYSYLSVVLVQCFLVYASNGFQELQIDLKVQRRRILGYSVGSVHYSVEKEWMDSSLYSLLPSGLYGSYGILFQVTTLLKALNRLLNRYFMKDILLSFDQKKFLSVIKLSVTYVALLLLPVVFGYVIFEFFGENIFYFMNVDILPRNLVRLFFVLMLVEVIGNPLTTLMLGVKKIFNINVVLLLLMLLSRVFFKEIVSLQQFMVVFILLKLVVILLGYMYIVLNKE